MENVTVNLLGKATRRRQDGREYLVAPMTLIVPGVLPGSNGPLLYPADEVSRNAADWNGTPIVVYHPTANGVPVSARDPDVIAKRGIGTVYKTNYDGALKAEGWFDVENTRRVDPRVLDALESGTPIGLSTGLFLKLEPAAPDAAYNGVSYGATARGYRPDHLAILPDQKGACSLEDGCGVFLNVRDNPEWDKMSPVTGNALSHDTIRAALSNLLRANFTQSDPYCYIYEVYDTYLIYEQGERLYKQRYSTLLDTVALQGEPAEVAREITYAPVGNSDMAMNAEHRGKLVDSITTNCACWSKPSDKEVLNKMSDEQLEALARAGELAKSNPNNPAPVTPPQTPPPAVAPAPAPQPAPAITRNEYDQLMSTLNALNGTVQTLAASQAEQVAARKSALVSQLTDNLVEPNKAAMVAVYNTMTVEQLAVIAQNAPAVVAGPFGQPLYAAGAPPVANATPDDEPLMPPTINYEEESDFARARKQRGVA